MHQNSFCGKWSSLLKDEDTVQIISKKSLFILALSFRLPELINLGEKSIFRRRVRKLSLLHVVLQLDENQSNDFWLICKS